MFGLCSLLTYKLLISELAKLATINFTKSENTFAITEKKPKYFHMQVYISVNTNTNLWPY